MEAGGWLGPLSRRTLHILVFLEYIVLYSEPHFALIGFFSVKVHDTFHFSVGGGGKSCLLEAVCIINPPKIPASQS